MKYIVVIITQIKQEINYSIQLHIFEVVETVKIVLTADQAVFTDYNGADLFGFGLCMPCRLIPEFVEYFVLVPKAAADSDGRARFAPYSVAKVEASLLAAGFSRDEVMVTPPYLVRKVIDKDTEVVAVHVLDPKGLAPVSWTLRSMAGGGKSCTELEFEKLIETIGMLKRRYKFKLIVGGPGVWQLRGLEDRYDIDVLYDGEAEITFPIIVRKILNGEEVPRYVKGEPVPAERIPLIATPSRNGQVQITRGCPRRCRFCSPTMWVFRSIPIEKIEKEIEFNLRNGAKTAGFITEDVLLYGAKGLQLNPDAIKKLYNRIWRLASSYGVDVVGFSHVSCASAVVLKETVKYIADLQGLSENKPLFPQVGLESGSPRIVSKYFNGKVYPWKARDWPWVVVEASKIFNDAYWYPCYTYLIGYPDATPDDYLKTIELLDRLDEEGFKGWTFPLLLIPMGGTLIEKEAKFLRLSQLPQEALECMTRGWRLSLKFSKGIISTLIKTRNPLITKIVTGLIDKALKAMNMWIENIEKNPEVIEEEFARINIRGMRNLTGTIIKAILPKTKKITKLIPA